MLVLWLVSLAPWLVMAGLAVMAFDAGITWQASIFVAIIWTYPISVVIALFGLKWPRLIWAPALHIGVLALFIVALEVTGHG